MPKRGIRFGVGDASKRMRATTWSCWTNGNVKKDVYVACRPVAGSLKVSLHETGQWHVAFHYSTFPTMFAEGSAPETRFLGKWERAQPLTQGVTLACRIYTPWHSVTVQPQDLDTKVAWLPPASAGQAVEVTIFLCEAHFKSGEWPACRTMGTQPVGGFDIDGGGEVWIVYRHVQALPYQPLKEAKPHYFKGATESEVLGAGNRMLAWGRHDDGSIVFHDLLVTVTKDP